MPKVQTTIFQNPIEVPDDEVAVLRAQGVLVEDPPDEPAGKPAAPAAKPDTKENDA